MLFPRYYRSPRRRRSSRSSIWSIVKLGCAPLFCLRVCVCVVKNVLMLASSTIRDELHHLVWNPRLWNQLSTDFHWRSNEPTTNLQTIHFGTRSSLITGRSTYQYPYTKKIPVLFHSKYYCFYYTKKYRSTNCFFHVL